MAFTFDALRDANRRRLVQFKKPDGTPHHEPDGMDWSPAEWLEAAVGELGEYANFSKKHRRGDMPEEEFLAHARKELADTVTYLDLLALRLGIDLGRAVIDKFNEISDRRGVPTKISYDGIVLP